MSLLLPATSESNSFIQLSLKEIVGGGRGDTYTFSYRIFSRFHLDSLRDTIAWECIVKDDGVRSRLIELQSFSLSKLYTDRICEREEIVQGDEGPVGGVAQVVCHGVKVVGVHGEEGREEEGEKQGEVERQVEELRDNRTCAWREDGMTYSRDLEPSGM